MNNDEIEFKEISFEESGLEMFPGNWPEDTWVTDRYGIETILHTFGENKFEFKASDFTDSDYNDTIISFNEISGEGYNIHYNSQYNWNLKGEFRESKKIIENAIRHFSKEQIL